LRSLDRLRKLDDPCEPLFDAIAQLMEEAESFADDTLARAISYRDAALLAFLLILPVRLNTLKQLTVGTPDNQVWFEGDEMYVMILRPMLKNGMSMGSLEVDGLKSELTEAIQRYLEVGRPRLIGKAKTELLFVGSHDGGLMWNGASTRVRHLTRRFLSQWVPDGLPMQSFRHLVATRYLKLNPGNYQGVASLLHDKLQTVLDTYAPKDPTDAIKRNAHRVRRRRDQ
jgi:integrase